MPNEAKTVIHKPRQRSPRCRREGCPHRRGQDAGYCCLVCKSLDGELSRLQELYQTAGDPTLNRDAWGALVSICEDWTAYALARRRLRADIRDAGLPMPPLRGSERSPSIAASGSRRTPSVDSLG